MVQQDSTSTIKMTKGGQRVCGNRTRNIDVRYFSITERINDRMVVVLYSPTKEIVSNYLSKPLQGFLFRLHRNAIMRITSADYDQYKMEYAFTKAAKKET